jgi:hypothetical protein
MTSDEAKALLEKNILSQAKYFLENADEFYPFGSIINNKNEVQPLGIYFGEENPKSQDVLNRLQFQINEGIKNKTYKYGAIGIDIYINKNSPSGIEKKTAIEVQFLFPNDSIKKIFLYYKTNNQYSFQPHSP